MTNDMKSLRLTVELTDDQAWQFAHFLKRVGYTDYRNLSTSDSEAHSMLEAGEVVRQALTEAGYAPR